MVTIVIMVTIVTIVRSLKLCYRKLVVKKKRQLLKRRQKLLTQLCTVFPIEQSRGSNMTICGVELNLTDQVSSGE